MKTKAHGNHIQANGLCGGGVFCLCYSLLAQQKNEACCRSAEKHVTRTMDRSNIVIETIGDTRAIIKQCHPEVQRSIAT